VKKSRLALAVVAAGSLIASLAACSSGGSGTSQAEHATNCTNKLMVKSAPTVTVWAWYPNMANVVDNFNAAHKDVQICWRNAGQGVAEYDKFQTTVSANKGAPDVVMLESDHLTTFEIQKALVDIAPLGGNKIKSQFSAGAIKDVSSGNAIYAAPVDGGPMALIYRTDVFKKYGIKTPPTTWAEYAADAKKVHDAGGPAFGDLGSNVPAPLVALQIQKGAVPFVYDFAKDPKKITIKVNDQASKDVLDYWAKLSQAGQIGKQDQFTTDYVSGVVNGKYATYLSAAWAPGYLTGAGVGKGADKGKFAVAPLPQWDASNPVQVNWGGSAFAVTSQATDKKLAAEVALGMYADSKSLTEGWQKQIIFPLNKSVLSSSEFVNAKVDFFNGQTANKDIYIPAANAYQGTPYSPFETYYYAQLTAQIAAINSGKISGPAAADALQQNLVSYAKKQGFTVSD